MPSSPLASDASALAERASGPPAAEPAPCGSSLELHNRRLLGQVALAQLALAAWASIQNYTLGDHHDGPIIGNTLAVGAAGYVVAYLASRRGSRGVLTMLLATEAWVILGIVIRIGHFADLNALTLGAWLGTIIVTASAVASFRYILTLSGALVASLLVTLLGVGGASGMTVLHPLMLLASVAALVGLASRHRDKLEAERQRELRERNTELERLRRSLEVRVAERTRELEASHDELSRAYEALKRNQSALVSAEKMAVLGRLTAGIAHEMSSPLSAIRSSLVEVATLVDEYRRAIGDDDVTREDHREIAREMHTSLDLARLAAERSAAFVRSIKSQTRLAGPQQSERFEAAASAREALCLLSHAARDAQCTMRFETTAEHAALDGAPNKLSQALTNLLQNAIDATAEKGGGEVLLTLSEGPQNLRFEVRDQGPGIPPELLPRIFEPLFTTKPYGKGTGLGLSIAREIIEHDFHGHIHVDPAPGRGATFAIELPSQKGTQAHA